MTPTLLGTFWGYPHIFPIGKMCRYFETSIDFNLELVSDEICCMPSFYLAIFII